MIKLTITTPLEVREFSFSKNDLLIGGRSLEKENLYLPESPIDGIILKIEKRNEVYLLINILNDPFITLNGSHFGKTLIKNQDTIQLNKVTILFEVESKSIIQEEEDDEELKNLLAAVAQLDTTDNNISESNEISDSKKEDLNFIQKWKGFIALFTGSLFTALVISITLYIKTTSVGHLQAKLAAEGVADIAMALTFAQVSHLKPQIQNWSDPDFLKTSLASIYSGAYPSFAYIDNQGQFKNCPYILRIYTSNDLSHFVIIAQPEPGIIQSLIPKPAIVIESQSMQLYQINDLRSINRLLTNSEVLIPERAETISQLIKQGHPLSLSEIKETKEFTPPKILGVLRPGAQNYIYNAPRYHHFGTSLLNDALNLENNPTNTIDAYRLQQQLVELKRFPDLVLYSTQGIEKTIKAQKIITELFPNEHLFGTLYLNKNKEIILSQILLNEETSSAILSSLLTDSLNSLVADAKNNIENHNLTDSTKKIEMRHPFYQHLVHLSQQRKEALSTISDEITEAFLENNAKGESHFSEKINNLTEKYKTEEKFIQLHQTTQILNLYKDSPSIPLDQLIDYLRASNLEILTPHIIPELVLLKFKEAEKEIQQTRVISELEKLSVTTSQLLTPLYLKDLEQILALQKELKGTIRDRLRRILLSPLGETVDNTSSEKNRQSILHILQLAEINEPDEISFFLKRLNP